MSQANVRTKDAISYISSESTFGTTAASYGVIQVINNPIPEVEQTNIPNTEESPFLFDYRNPILGLKSGKVTLQGYVRAASTQLDNGATPPSTPPDMSLFPLVLGGERIAAGSAVQTSSTTSSIICETGDGSNFKAGQPFLVEAPQGTLEWTIVGSVATDTITPALTLAGTPYTTGKIINSACWYYTPSNTNSIAFRHALASNSNAQWQLMGGQCADAFKVTVERDKPVTWEFPLQFVTYQRGALSISTTIASDSQGPRFVAGMSAQCCLQAAATTTKTNYSIESLTIETKSGMTMMPEIAGAGVEGTAGWMRTEGRELTKLTVRGRFDTAFWTLYSAQTDCRFVYALPYGSGLTQRWFFIVVNKCVIVGEPKDIDEGGRLLTEVVLMPKINTSSTDTFVSTPIIFAVA